MQERSWQGRDGRADERIGYSDIATAARRTITLEAGILRLLSRC